MYLLICCCRFDSNDLPNMVYSDQFLQYSIKLQSSKIYGLGEHRSSLMLSTNWQRFTMFAHDAVPTENVSCHGTCRDKCMIFLNNRFFISVQFASKRKQF